MMYGRLYAIAVMVVLSAAIAVGCKKDGDGDGNDGRISFPVESYIVDYTSTLVVVDYESDFDVEVTGLPSWCQLERMEPGAAVIAVGRNDGQRRSGSVVFSAGGGRSEFAIVQRGKAISGNGMIRVDSLVSVGRKGAVVMLAPLYDGVSVTPSVKEGAEWIHLRASSYATLSQVAVEVDENTGESPRKGVVYFASDRGDIDSTVIWQAGKDEISIDGDVTVDSYFNAVVKMKIRTGRLSAGEKITSAGYYISWSDPLPGPGGRSMTVGMGGQDANNIYLDIKANIYRGLIPGRSYNIRYAMATDRRTYYSDTQTFSVPALPAVGPADMKIPVVFHVYYSGSGSVVENVSAEAVYNQIDMANFIWRGRFGGGVDTGVEFVPATHTPWGEPLAEPGIHRIAVSRPLSLTDDQFIFDGDYNDSFNLWDPKKYVNVWVMDVSMPDVAGYATIPSVPESKPLSGLASGDYYFTHPLDYMHGIVLDNEAVMSTNDGMTFAHEAGHLFGLLHAFSDNGCGKDDYCADTPDYDRSLYLKTFEQTGVHDFSRISCDGSRFTSVNVMDYFFGYAFEITPDQKRRIDHTLDYGIVGVTRSGAVKSLSYVDADAPKPEITIIH